MRTLFLFYYAILCFVCNNVQGQNTILYLTDSLDMIRPLSEPKAKVSGRKYTIKVKNQKQFDVLDSLIMDAIKTGETNIVVKIGRGVYKFHENHISLANHNQENVSITIIGCNTVITSDSNYSNDKYCISPWGVLTKADNLIEVVDEKNKLCKIPFLNTMVTTEVSAFKQVQITQWFKAPIYQVVRIDQSGIFFIAPDIEYKQQFGRNEYNVNYDYLYAGKTPRFRLFDKRKERPCTASCFLRVSNVKLRSITLQGLYFKGNKEGHSLFSMSSVETSKVLIRKCTFDFIRSKVASFSGTGNVLFDNNIVIHTNGDELSFNEGCKNVRVTNNEFKECGTGLGNTMCVRCNGAEYYIAGNTFCNFGYSAIGVGLWHGHEKKHDIRGIIEHNEIFFAKDYFVERDKYTLMDAGAIYVWTQNDEAIIRFNYIHDYGGMRFNSGIYCDDGASNCKVYGNVILNTPDGCSITSRKVKDQKPSFKNNANNFMAENIVDNAVVFAGYGDEERHCVKGANYVMIGKYLFENKFENLERNDEDVKIHNVKEVQRIKGVKWIIKEILSQ